MSMGRHFFAGVVLGFVLAASTASAADVIDLSEAKPDGITIAMTVDGPIFATAQGMALYRKGRDQPGRSFCTNEKVKTTTCCGGFVAPFPDWEKQKTCVEKWPPFVPTADAKPVGNFSILTREDGVKQWAYNGFPLYTSRRDHAPFEVNGSMGGFGAEGPIRVTSGLPNGFTFVSTPSGVSIATAGKDVLYALPADKAAKVKKVACASADCGTDAWRPVLGPIGASLGRDWTVITSNDLSQWAYRGKPLFTYALDEWKGQTNGLGIDSAQTIDVYKSAPPPKDIQERAFIFGKAFVTSKGMTLYHLTCNEGSSGLSCDEQGDVSAFVMTTCGGLHADCSKVFKPYEASPGAKPTDPSWSIVTVDPRSPTYEVKNPADGIKVWAYRGRPLYTYVHDQEPGEFEGDHIGELLRVNWVVARVPGPQMSER